MATPEKIDEDRFRRNPHQFDADSELFTTPLKGRDDSYIRRERYDRYNIEDDSDKQTQTPASAFTKPKIPVVFPTKPPQIRQPKVNLPNTYSRSFAFLMN